MAAQRDLCGDLSVSETPAPASAPTFTSESALALSIASATPGPEQKLFNQLLAKIEAATRAMQDLSVLSQQHHVERTQKLAEPNRHVRQLNESLILFLDRRLQTPKGLSKKQQDNLRDIACAVADDLAGYGETSAEVRAALDRLLPDDPQDAGDAKGGQDAASQRHAADMEDLKSAMSDMLGVDLDGDAGLDSPEALMEALMRQMQTEQERERQRREARAAKRKKPARQRQAEQDSLDADAALRTIYRKLASALHPDREPDETERIRKTQLMGRVNAANDARDLLALLRLQLEVEQIDAGAIARLADDKLRHYNRMLKEQLKTVQQELGMQQSRLRHEWRLPYADISARTLQASLRLELQRLQRQITAMRGDLRLMQDDKYLKAWAKEQVAMMDAPLGMADLAMAASGRGVRF
jgi:hypothetical protein